jgi:Domain of unknown function (DUF6532)
LVGRTKKNKATMFSPMLAFMPMPSETVVFALTAMSLILHVSFFDSQVPWCDLIQIQNTLESWADGIEKDIEFAAEIYWEYYKGHLDWIKSWSARHPEEWRGIGTMLSNAMA